MNVRFYTTPVHTREYDLYQQGLRINKARTKNFTVISVENPSYEIFSLPTMLLILRFFSRFFILISLFVFSHIVLFRLFRKILVLSVWSDYRS